MDAAQKKTNQAKQQADDAFLTASDALDKFDELLDQTEDLIGEFNAGSAQEDPVVELDNLATQGQTYASLISAQLPLIRSRPVDHARCASQSKRCTERLQVLVAEMETIAAAAKVATRPQLTVQANTNPPPGAGTGGGPPGRGGSIANTRSRLRLARNANQQAQVNNTQSSLAGFPGGSGLGNPIGPGGSGLGIPTGSGGNGGGSLAMASASVAGDRKPGRFL